MYELQKVTEMDEPKETVVKVEEESPPVIKIKSSKVAAEKKPPSKLNELEKYSVE